LPETTMSLASMVRLGVPLNWSARNGVWSTRDGDDGVAAERHLLFDDNRLICASQRTESAKSRRRGFSFFQLTRKFVERLSPPRR